MVLTLSLNLLSPGNNNYYLYNDSIISNENQ
jgi:hypothetical protein